MFQNPCDVHSTFISLVIPCFLLLGSHSGPKPGLPCKTAAMQNGSLGVRFDCTHTCVIQISPIHVLNPPSICFPFRYICCGIPAYQSGASRDRGGFSLKLEGPESYSRFGGQACGYSHMRGRIIDGQERGYVLYSGPTQPVSTGFAFTFIKIQVSGGINFNLKGGWSCSGPYATPDIQRMPDLLLSTHSQGTCAGARWKP